MVLSLPFDHFNNQKCWHVLSKYAMTIQDLINLDLVYCWSWASPNWNGLHVQLAISLFSCIYFLNEKMKNLLRASTTGFGILVGGWIIGSLLVPLVPTFIIPPSWSLELLTSLVAYIFLFLGSTFLKWICFNLVTGTVGSFEREITMTDLWIWVLEIFCLYWPLEIGILALLWACDIGFPFGSFFHLM